MNNENRQPIYISGYPKSGNTWLTRLLADCLNCPSGASVPKLDSTEPATGGQNRSEPFIVRKGHFLLQDGLDGGFVPGPHRMNWQLQKEERVIFIVRDPRDIAVSGSHYWNRTIFQFSMDMLNGTGGVRMVGNWGKYVRRWIEIEKQGFQFHTIRYEDLLDDPKEQILIALINLDLPIDEDRIDGAIVRQSFSRMKAKIQANGDSFPLGREANLRLLRQGGKQYWFDNFDDRAMLMMSKDRNFRLAKREFGY